MFFRSFLEAQSQKNNYFVFKMSHYGLDVVSNGGHFQVVLFKKVEASSLGRFYKMEEGLRNESHSRAKYCLQSLTTEVQDIPRGETC